MLLARDSAPANVPRKPAGQIMCVVLLFQPPHQLTDVACAALFAAGAADPAAAQRACAVLVARIGRCGVDGYARAALMQLFTAASRGVCFKTPASTQQHRGRHFRGARDSSVLRFEHRGRRGSGAYD